MQGETVPLSLTVAGIRVPAGCVKRGQWWILSAARYPEVVVTGMNVLKAQRELEAKLNRLVAAGRIPPPSPKAPGHLG